MDPFLTYIRPALGRTLCPCHVDRTAEPHCQKLVEIPPIPQTQRYRPMMNVAPYILLVEELARN